MRYSDCDRRVSKSKGSGLYFRIPLASASRFVITLIVEK